MWRIIPAMPTALIPSLIPASVAVILLVIAAAAARRGDPRSLTLLKVVGIGALIVSVAWMIFAVFSSTTICTKPGPRNKTTAIHRAIMSALENYRSEFGEYSQPVRRGTTLRMNGQTYEADAALMFYQVLSGDGNDAIEMKNNDNHSHGRWEGGEKMFLADMPKEMSKLTEAAYIIVDGYGCPFQYDRFSSDSGDVVNSTYDL